jgi:hypothetical protein
MNIGVIISMLDSEFQFQLTGRQSLCNTQNKGMKGFVMARVVFMCSLSQIVNYFVILAKFDERDIES